MNRDNFQLREHGGTMAQAFKLLEGDMAPKNQPSAEAKNSFEFSQGGVGLYIARSPEEEQDWARWIRQWSESDNCNLMEFSVTELMSASNILPPRDGIEEASIDLFDRCGVSNVLIYMYQGSLKLLTILSLHANPVICQRLKCKSARIKT